MIQRLRMLLWGFVSSELCGIALFARQSGSAGLGNVLLAGLLLGTVLAAVGHTVARAADRWRAGHRLGVGWWVLWLPVTCLGLFFMVIFAARILGFLLSPSPH